MILLTSWPVHMNGNNSNRLEDRGNQSWGAVRGGGDACCHGELWHPLTGSRHLRNRNGYYVLSAYYLLGTALSTKPV